MANLQHMQQFVKLLHERRKRDYDNFIAVTGVKGTGKSTFLYWAGREYMKQLGREFDLEKSVVYSDSFEEIFTKIKEAKDGDYLWFDEGGRIILAEDWNSANAKRLKKLFAEVRTRHLTVGFAVPFSFLRIDKKYRESFFNFWVWLPRRSFSIVFEPLVHPTLNGFMEEVITKKVKPLSWSKTLVESSETYFYESLKKFPSFLDIINYTAMPERDHKRYLELRDKAVYEEDSLDDQPKRVVDVSFAHLIDRIVAETGKTKNAIFEEIAKQCGIKASSISRAYRKCRSAAKT